MLQYMTDIADTTTGLGAALKSRRKRLEMTQLEVANLSGVNRETVVRAERGDEGVSLGTLTRIARAVGLEVTLEPVYRTS
jgi:transcriptional regulator with XRE-family HTH domain